MNNTENATNITTILTDFIQNVGIVVKFENIDHNTEVPGLTIKNGELIVDNDKLLYPGDLLYEAGLIAVVPTKERQTITEDGKPEQTTEVAAIAWAYAASRYLDIDPHIVFHEHGYKGMGASIVYDFTTGKCHGAPMLDWHGMTNYGQHNPEWGTFPYPNMKHWVSQQ